MLIRLLAVLLICAAAIGTGDGALAQGSAKDGYEQTRTEALVGRAQRILDNPRASLKVLEEVRAELSRVRDTAQGIVNAGSVEARAIQARIEALGPKPAEGATEAEDIAARREELNNELALANRPIRDANESLKQANFLIGEIDRRIREKGAEQLLTRLPSPLLPSSWAAALRDTDTLVTRFTSDLAQEPAEEGASESRSNLWIAAIVSASLGLLLIFVVTPFVAGRLDRSFETRPPGYRRWHLPVLSTLARFVLPYIGAVLLLIVVPVLGLSAQIIDLLAPQALHIAMMMLIAYWLGHVVFAPTAPSRRMLPLSDGEAAQGVWLFLALGVVAAAEDILELFQTEMRALSGATFPVLALPIFIFAGIALWRLATIVRHSAQNAAERDKGDETEALQRIPGFASFLVLLLRISAVLPVLVTLAGYLQLAQHLADAMVMTLLILGVALFLYNVILLAIEGLTGGVSEEDEKLPLMPIVVVFMLGLAILPLLALAWGARTTDIAETWRFLSNGIRIGDATLSLNGLVTLVLVFAIGLLATRWIQRLLRETVLPRTRLDIGARSALITGVGYAGFTLAGLIAVSAAGLNLSNLAWIVGALSLGIGFGLQTIVSNFVSGIILLVERPIKEGDWIEVSGYSGTVRKIAVRSTRIETFDRHDVIVPNQDLIANPVKNMTLTSQVGRLIIPVGVAYGSDLEKTRNILSDAAANNPSVLSFPAPMVLFTGLGDSALMFELRCHLRDINTIVATQSELLFEIYNQLGKAGIEIPFPQRDLHLRDIDRLVDAIAGRRAARGRDRAPAEPEDAERGDRARRPAPPPGGLEPDVDMPEPDGDQD